MVINLIFINRKNINTRQIYGKAHKQKQKMPIIDATKQKNGYLHDNKNRKRKANFKQTRINFKAFIK